MIKGFKLEWNDKEVLKTVGNIVKSVSKDVAEMVLADAKKILATKSKEATGDLASQGEVKKSKFPEGGHIVGFQLTGNWKPPYRASFVELGTHKMTAIPYLRPAMHKNKRKAKKMFKDALK